MDMQTSKPPADFDVAGHLKRLNEDGYTIVEDFLSPGQLAAFRAGMAAFFGTHRGRNDFEGRTTERVYTMVARGAVFEEITADPRLMALLAGFLKPSFLLSASHAICIYPGEAAQSLHFDDSFYQVQRPRPPIGMSVIGAIDAFTAENGGTVIYPGSHAWPVERGVALREALDAGKPSPESSFALTMPAGAICLFQGTLIHGAGANRSTAPRMAFTNQYCEPWVRTQENFYLAVPKERVAAMSPQLQTLLGYNLNQSGFMGMVTGSHPAKTLAPDWVSPLERQAPH